MMDNLENLKGITIYHRWLFVKNKLYLVTGKGSDRKFKLALVFYNEPDEIKIHYMIDKIPIGVVRKAQKLFEVASAEEMEDVSESND